MTELSFNERQPGSKQDHGPRKLDYVLAGAGHLLIILAGSIAFSSAAGTMTGGEDAMMVSMVTVRSEAQGPRGETVVPEEVQEEIPEDVQEEVVVPEPSAWCGATAGDGPCRATPEPGLPVRAPTNRGSSTLSGEATGPLCPHFGPTGWCLRSFLTGRDRSKWSEEAVPQPSTGP